MDPDIIHRVTQKLRAYKFIQGVQKVPQPPPPNFVVFKNVQKSFAINRPCII